jgi:hypothetical protein
MPAIFLLIAVTSRSLHAFRSQRVALAISQHQEGWLRPVNVL